MISTMIQNREYADTLHHFSSKINRDLVTYAEAYYGVPLTNSQKSNLFSMELADKQWLLDEYKQEITFAPVDFDNIY
jgi:hypothetical protein